MNRAIKVLPNPVELVHEAADRIVDMARRAVQEKGKFSIALSGGNTPKALYDLLASDAYRSQIDWKAVSVYFGDERCVPPDSEQSNYRMADLSLLSKAPIPPAQVHRMRGEIDPEAAAREYGELLKAHFGESGPDLILLGMGDDGHTASLFPHTKALQERKHRCVANFVEKLNTWRVTMTAPFINKAWEILILVAGKEKAARLAEVLEVPTDTDRLPIQMIQPDLGRVTWMLDAAAAGMQEDE